MIRLRVPRRLVALLLALAPLLSGCDREPFGPSDLVDFVRARERWQVQRPPAYRYITRTACFCPPEVNEPAIVTVYGDSVVAVASLDGTAIPRSRWFGRGTIDSLFVRALSVPTDRVVRIRYDATYGYPTVIEVAEDRYVSDGGFTIYASELRPVPIPVATVSTGGRRSSSP